MLCKKRSLWRISWHSHYTNSSHTQIFKPSRWGDRSSTQDLKKRAEENILCFLYKHDVSKVTGSWGSSGHTPKGSLPDNVTSWRFHVKAAKCKTCWSWQSKGLELTHLAVDLALPTELSYFQIGCSDHKPLWLFSLLSIKIMTFWEKDCSCSSKQTQGFHNMTLHSVFLL